MTDTPNLPPEAEAATAAPMDHSEESPETVEPQSLEAEVLDASDLEHDPEKLLGFYDKLRKKILKAVEKRGGKMSGNAVRVLLMVPDIFLLLVRLVMDRDVPAGTRALIGSVLAYFVLPVDLLPEAILGGAGFLDDIVLATAVIAQAFGGELEPYARKHWSGPEDLRTVLRDVSESAQGLLGGRVYKQLQRFTGKPNSAGD